MSYRIEKAAVLGSGVMGSAIAAHLANAGIPSIMLDVVPKDAAPEDRNRLAAEALKAALKSRPAPFFIPHLASLVTVGNFEDDWDKIADADWIIEVVKEDLAIKRSVLAKVAEHRKPGAIVSSNTSGLSVREMVDGLDDEFRSHFLGTHFFNPPRYLKLLEIVPTDDVDPAVIEAIGAFVDMRMGKGVVTARDTPNFVANRIGVFGLLDAIPTMQDLGLTVEEVDFLTGPLIGHPKSASFRTADLVGLDTFIAVAGNVYHGCPDDEARDTFRVPPLLQRMVDAGLLGAKSGAGFYKKVKSPDGKKRIDTLDLENLEYRERIKPRFAELEAARNLDDLRERIPAIVASGGKAAEFTWRTTSRVLWYAANRVGEICDGPRDIDDAMKWGFGWELGPFEIWDALGFRATVERMRADGLTLAPWIEAMYDAGADHFYRVADGRVAVWDPAAGELAVIPPDPSRIDLTVLKTGRETVRGNAGASLLDLGDGVACLEFHTKMNAIGPDIIQMIEKSLAVVDSDFDGLVVANQGKNYSAGANLMLILLEAQEQNWEDIELMIRGFQRAVMAMKYSAKPVVTAPFGMTLGGGAEVTLHGQRVRPAAETYIGLVEVGAGVIPAGGGCKELYLRQLERSAGRSDVQAVVRRTFETIGMARVATSAVEARDMGFLRDTDRITMNPDRQVQDAKQTVLSMVREGWRPGAPRTDIPVAGRAGKATLEVGLFNMAGGGFISDHDRKIGRKLAHVLSGGDLTGAPTVSEQYLLDLEREAFLSLLGERKTLERIQSLLKTGKPLRN